MILIEPNPKLHQICEEVHLPQIKKLAKSLIYEYENYHDLNPDVYIVGLSAPQIGKTVRAFYALGEVFINPVVEYSMGEMVHSEEGCLSLGEDIYKSKRFKAVYLRWMDMSRRIRRMRFESTQAIIIQHEMDHLDGITLQSAGAKKAHANTNS